MQQRNVSKEIINSDYHNGIALMKFVMALVVVAIHTEPLFCVNNTCILSLYNSVTSLAVPFFFLASGYFLGLKLVLFPSDKNFTLLKNRLKTVIILYLIWTVVYTPLTVINDYKCGTDTSVAALKYAVLVLLKGEQHNAWHLWYLLSCIYVLLFMFFVFKRKNVHKALLITCILGAVVSALFDFVTGTEFNNALMISFKQLILHSFGFGKIFRGFIYFPAGVLLSRKRLPLSECLWLFLSGFVASVFLSGRPVCGFAVIPAAIGLFELVKRTNLVEKKIYHLLGDMSKYIYLVHMMVWTVLCQVSFNGEGFGPMQFAATFALSAVVSIVFLQVRRKILPKNGTGDLANMQIDRDVKMCENSE